MDLEAEFFSIFEQLNAKFTEPKNWAPTIAASGPMTISNESIEHARYCITGRRFEFDVYVTFTTATAGSTDVTLTLPSGIRPTTTAAIGEACFIDDGGITSGFWQWDDSAGVIKVQTDGAANWSLGASRAIRIINSFEISK